MKKILKTQRSLFVVLGMILAVWVAEQITGLRVCAIQSGSMEPTIPTYSMCLVTTRADYSDLKIGDIVVYTRAADGKKIVHRVVAITDTGAVTKGDANRADDGVSVTADNLYAKYLAHVPYIGYVRNLACSPLGITLLVVLVACVIVCNAIDAKRRKEPE